MIYSTNTNQVLSSSLIRYFFFELSFKPDNLVFSRPSNKKKEKLTFDIAMKCCSEAKSIAIDCGFIDDFANDLSNEIPIFAVLSQLPFFYSSIFEQNWV